MRESLRERSEFDFLSYADLLWRVLESAHVPGIAKHDSAYRVVNDGTTYDFSQAPHQLRVVANEAFFYLIHNGMAVPGPATHVRGFGDKNRYYMTARGLAWASGVEPLPGFRWLHEAA